MVVHFRKVPDRSNCGQEVLLMKINPMMDIVALALFNGDIILHRLLTWQRVWFIGKSKSLKTNFVIGKSLDGNDGEDSVKVFVCIILMDRNIFVSFT